MFQGRPDMQGIFLFYIHKHVWLPRHVKSGVSSDGEGYKVSKQNSDCGVWNSLCSCMQR